MCKGTQCDGVLIDEEDWVAFMPTILRRMTSKGDPIYRKQCGNGGYKCKLFFLYISYLDVTRGKGKKVVVKNFFFGIDYQLNGCSLLFSAMTKFPPSMAKLIP